MQKRLSFLKRASLTRHPVASQLFKLMEKKQSNLCLALDVTRQKDLLHLADQLGPELCVLKTHIDILEDFTPDVPLKLREIAQKHRFFLFEDRKFADIGQTVSLQYGKGIYQIATWADLINAHLLPGPGIIEGLKQVGMPLKRGLLLLAEMSSKGTLAKGSYSQKAVQWAEEHLDFVCGFISLRKLSPNPGLIHFTPGVQLQKGKDGLGQTYRSLEEILVKNQSDVLIVGRDISQHVNPKKQAQLYREQAWSHYVKCLS